MPEWEEGSIDHLDQGEDGEDGSGGGGGGDEVQGVFNVPTMAMGQVFPGESVVTSMDFHEDGELCVTANSDK